MAALAEILVLIDEGTRRRSLFRSRGAARLRLLRWDRVTGRDLERRNLRAVVFESAAGVGDRRRRRDILQQVPAGVARISLLPPSERGKAARSADGDIQLSTPVDLRLLDALLARERRWREGEETSRRSRRVAGQVSRQLKTLAEVIRRCSAEFEPRKIAEVALQEMTRICPVAGWSVLLLDEEKSCLQVSAARGREMGALVGTRLGVGEGAAGRVLRSRQPLALGRPPAAGAPGLLPEVPGSLDWSHLLALPLLSRGKAVGAVELLRNAEQRPFRRRDIRILSLLLEPMAIHLENARLLRRSEELSVTDDLTKLFNSRYLNSCLLREVQRARRYGAKVSLIFLDLDGFKNVNDQHGHLAGSRALVEVGAVIRNMVREIDVVSRFGGDEFTVILPQTGPEGARIIADRIRARIAETVFLETFGLRVSITASFGIASFPEHADSKDSLIQKADQAMYRVKGSGKNGVQLAEVSEV